MGRLDRRDDNELLARTVKLPFPDAVRSGEEVFRSVSVSHAIRGSFLERLFAYDPSKSTLSDQFPESGPMQLGWQSIEREYSATISRDRELVSELSLHE